MKPGQIASQANELLSKGLATSVGNLVFAGGFSLGVQAANWGMAGQLEHVDVGGLGVATSRQRFTVTESDAEGWIRELAPLRNRLHFLYANPPCSAFAGPGRHGGLADPVMCFLEYAKQLALHTLPQTWCWELVPSVYTKAREFVEAMAAEFAQYGYKCYVVFTTASNHGGYQDRQRFHFFASRVELRPKHVFDTAPPEWRGFKPIDTGLAEIAALVENGAVLPNHNQHYSGANIPLLPWTPPGSHLASLPAILMQRHYRHHGGAWRGKGRPSFTQTRGRNGFPCPTIMGGFSVVHPELDRYITVREAAHMMGFPVDYEIKQRSPTKAMAEVGKGLTVNTARFIGAIALDGALQARGVTATSKIEVHDFRVSPVGGRKMRLTEEEQKEWQLAKHGTFDYRLLELGHANAKVTDQEDWTGQ